MGDRCGRRNLPYPNGPASTPMERAGPGISGARRLGGGDSMGRQPRRAGGGLRLIIINEDGEGGVHRIWSPAAATVPRICRRRSQPCGSTPPGRWRRRSGGRGRGPRAGGVPCAPGPIESTPHPALSDYLTGSSSGIFSGIFCRGGRLWRRGVRLPAWWGPAKGIDLGNVRLIRTPRPVSVARPEKLISSMIQRMGRQDQVGSMGWFSAP